MSKLLELKLEGLWLASCSLLVLSCNAVLAAQPAQEKPASPSHSNSKASPHPSDGTVGGAHGSNSAHASQTSGAGNAGAARNTAPTSNASATGAHSTPAPSGVNADDYAQTSEPTRHNVGGESQQQSEPATSATGQADLDRFRLKREYTPRLYGNAEVKHHYYPPSGGASMLGQSGNYAPMMSQPGAYTPMQNAQSYQPQYGTVNTFMPPPPVMQAQGNYIWEQSANGGYYDATGQIKNLVMGDQLFRYGGKFPDGTAVPTTPVVCNFQGHVYLPYVVKR